MSNKLYLHLVTNSGNPDEGCYPDGRQYIGIAMSAKNPVAGIAKLCASVPGLSDKYLLKFEEMGIIEIHVDGILRYELRPEPLATTIPAPSGEEYSGDEIDYLSKLLA